ncbi:PHP domain-containing protein [Luteitalea sp.]|uniref:PHP domain-containing protein n=1 Tax=Luteitalea sp. TaxID=2004800 RepID=UPI0037CC4093
MIDLHMHTTASDGRCSPEDLVQRCWDKGIRTMAVTDHDTMAGVLPTQRAAEARGMTCLPGIEITSVHGGKDVHMLAYFLPEDAPGLQPMLAAQRQQRVNRALEIASRLERLGAPVDRDAMIEAAAGSGKSLARPQIAQALITAGHVTTVAEAFDRYLGEDSPAYVPHTGVTPAEVVALVVAGGGIPSLAHPGYRPKDDIIPGLVDAGLVAMECYHSSHDEAATAHYLGLARQHGLLVTGGSDFHGPGTRREEFFGVVQLPEADLAALLARAGR